MKGGFFLFTAALVGGFLYAQFTPVPSIIWTSDSDWGGGTFTNVTNITGDLMLNNTIQNGTQTIF